MHEIKAVLATLFLSGHAPTEVNPKLIAVAVDHAEAVIAEIDKRETAARAATAPVTPPPAP